MRPLLALMLMLAVTGCAPVLLVGAGAVAGKMAATPTGATIAYDQFLVLINNGQVPARRQDDGTLLFQGRVTTAKNGTYRCTHVRSADDGSIAERLGGVIAGQMAKVAANGCTHV